VLRSIVALSLVIAGLSMVLGPRTSQALSGPALEGLASWYSHEDTGVTPWTANAEPFDDQELTCAIWGIPFNTYLKVTNMATGEAVIVRVNDRGPAERLVVAEQRVIDLTKAAFARIAEPRQGLVWVRVEFVRPAVLEPL